MANAIEIIDIRSEEFVAIQTYMELAKKEGAEETYNTLKRRYLRLKALLEASGINLTNIDLINEN